MKIGDKVKVIQKFNGLDCNISGTIVSFYRKDNVIIRTPAGHEWAIKKELLETSKL